MVGRTLDHYRIDSQLGAGGMGVVYRARDERLERDVALKVLPAGALTDEAARARFRKEALALSQLNHPHICAIYDVGRADGQDYIVMELVGGRRLGELAAPGGMPVGDVIRYGSQVADALAHAHDRGLVHRDLKSSNVMVTPEGRSKVLDFGLAKRLRDAEAAEATRSQGSLTQAGSVVGTLHYMPPEVLQGEPADARSDLWALGVMLYEMAAGRLPFRGQTGFAVSSAILKEAPEPLPPQVPEGLRAVIGRCLEKQPGQRYQRAGEVLAALEATRSGAAPPQRIGRRALVASAALLIAALAVLAVVLLLRRPPPPIESLAVLPLQNLSGDSAQDYFADGITEALITDLGQIRALRVISRTSVARYKGTRKPLPEIARELNVKAVVEGSVVRSGGRVRITAQLVDAAADRQLWSGRFERDLADVLALESEVARAIAREVQAKATPQEQARLAKAGAVKPQAYDYYLRAKFHSTRVTRAENQTVIAMLEQAVSIDPSFAAAHASLARACMMRNFLLEPDRKWEEKAFVAMEKALALDPELAEAYAARGQSYWTHANRFPHERAIREYRRALALNPNSDEAHQQLGLVYYHIGLLDKAFEEFQATVTISPGNDWARFRSGIVLILDGKRDQAFAIMRSIPKQFNPQTWGHHTAWLLLSQGNKQEALAALAEARKDYPADEGAMLTGMEALVLAASGERLKAEDAIRRAAEKGKGFGHFHHASYQLGAASALLGNADEALRWLEFTAEDGFPCYPLFAQDPNLDPIRKDPRFVSFLARRKTQWEQYRAAL